MQQIFNDAACTVCGCVCDDLQLTTEGDRVVQVRGACRLAEPWFAALQSAPPSPVAMIDGEAASLDEAVELASSILRPARTPLVYGLSRSSTAGQRAAIALADKLRATIDTPASSNPAAALALQTVGQSTCSLGEVRNRADLVIFWRTNPLVTHPRHLERYSAEPVGLFLPNGRADRNIVVIDECPTETSRVANNFLEVEPNQDWAVIETLRKLVNDERSDIPPDCGVAPAHLRQLAANMKSCRYGALFFGVGQGASDESRQAVEALLHLVTELNKSTRFTAHYLPPAAGPIGAETVLCWQTGFPFAVDFAAGFPRFDATAYTANTLLERGDVDACLLVGSAAASKLSSAAQQALKSINAITLDYPNASSTMEAKVSFTTAIYGIHASGTAYRMDGVPIPLRTYIATEYPTDDEVLNAIAAKL